MTAGVQVRRLDPADDAACAAVHRVLSASRAAGRPWDRPVSLAETVADLRHVDPTQDKDAWVAVDVSGSCDEVVGVARMWLPLLDNRSFAYVDVQVDPPRRRQGIGSTLVDLLAGAAREHHRTMMLTDTFVPEGRLGDHPYALFLARKGFHLVNTEVVRHLDLPVPEDVLERLAEAARVRYSDAYRVETYVDGVPEHLRASLCLRMGELALDAPTGDVEYEAQAITPERYESWLDLEREQKRTRLTTVAVHEASGEVVAYTVLVLPPESDLAVQYGTLVHRNHRGHRLGTAVKVGNLRRLQADHPERRKVETSNAETNPWMVDINLSLGFRVVELLPEYARVLA